MRPTAQKASTIDDNIAMYQAGLISETTLHERLALPLTVKKDMTGQNKPSLADIKAARALLGGEADAILGPGKPGKARTVTVDDFITGVEYQRAVAGRWLVPSSSDPTRTYTVTLRVPNDPKLANYYHCNCPSWRYQGMRCKHTDDVKVGLYARSDIR